MEISPNPVAVTVVWTLRMARASRSMLGHTSSNLAGVDQLEEDLE